MRELPEGKAPAGVLKRLLGRIGADASLPLGPAPGEDAAVVRPEGAERIVLASDPITFPSPDPGWQAVIAATGGEPRWFLSTVIAPPGTTDASLEEVADGIRRGCAEVGATPVGGHTEVSSAVERLVVSGVMAGTATPERIKPSGGAREGDMLIITKGIAVEATSVVAEARAADVREAFGEEFRKGVLDVHAMHDVTEGGVATAIREMAEASGVGVVVAETEIPRFFESKRVLGLLRLDILGAIGSGALLIACAESGTEEFLSRLNEAGTPGYVIGRFTDASRGHRLLRGSGDRELPRFEVDELARL